MNHGVFMSSFSRRQALAALSGLGIGSLVFQRSLAAQVQDSGKEITVDMISQSEWIAGLELSEEERKAIINALKASQRNYAALRAVPLDNSVAPAIGFLPRERAGESVAVITATPIESHPPQVSTSSDELAFLPVTELAALIKSRAVTSVELTRRYLDRLKKYDPALKCVVSLTEELALKQAEAADNEIAAGRYRGALHGIPWGAKDILAVPGYKTTWGAVPYQEQTIDRKATVVQRLESAGAVLVAKLTVGALAMGDQWFGGMTHNPWNVKQGSSGSSAGSASATVAGLVGFALGTETLGSIVSPTRRCSVTGLRPTFGRVSRYGAMTLSWTMDKIGPIARSVEDCALIFAAICGSDGLDHSVADRSFAWPVQRDLRSFKVGYFPRREREATDREDLKVLKDLGVTLVEMSPLPNEPPASAMLTILNAECSAAFDDLTRKHVLEGIGSWPATFREGQFIPAVEYLRAARHRAQLVEKMRAHMREVDAYIGGNDLVITNFSGNPTVVIPFGSRENDSTGQPQTITMTGRVDGDDALLWLAHHVQQATSYHLKRPDLGKALSEANEKTEGK
jgi:Asp-tRNA(Asn)/Glu-tRNA(Gln) amidotransferase A subunit family amidase